MHLGYIIVKDIYTCIDSNVNGVDTVQWTVVNSNLQILLGLICKLKC